MSLESGASEDFERDQMPVNFSNEIRIRDTANQFCHVLVAAMSV